MKTYDPIQRFDQGGIALGEMKECPDGDWVKLEYCLRMQKALAGLVDRFDELSDNDHYAIGRELIAAAREAIAK